jgi:hypothetical protein
MRTSTRLSLSSVIALALLGAVCESASAYALYATGHTGGGPSTFYRLVPAPVAIGPIGFDRVGAIDSHPFTQELYACGERTDGTPVLIRIDPLTGAGTEIGPTGIASAISDIAFRPSDGVLFAHVATPGVHALHTINIQTGAATLLGLTGIAGGGNALDFGPDGSLYLYTLTTLYRLSQTTGQSLSDSELDYSPTGNPAAADFGGFGEAMYLVIKSAFPTVYLAIGYPGETILNYQTDLGQTDIDGICFASRPFGYAASGRAGGASDLYRVDLTTGETTLIGPIGFGGVGAMEFVGGSEGYRALYATGVHPLTLQPSLITIDPATGKGTEVGPTGIAPNVGDLAFLAASSRLAGWQPINDPDQSVFEFHTTTGAASLIGDSGLSFTAGNGLAEIPTTATILHVGHSTMHTINTVTGAATLLGPLMYLPPITAPDARVPAMDFNWNGSLYALCRETTFDPRVSLATIDYSARTVSSLGDTGYPALDGFAARTDVAPLQQVLTPNGGEALGGGTVQSIAWETFDNPTVPTVEIAYTTGVELYAATSDALSATLYKLDVATGAATFVGGIGYGRVGGMVAHPITGALFAAADNQGERILMRLDPQTAYANRIGPTGTDPIGDLAWRESDNTLFAYNVFNNPTHSLHTLNYQIGKASLVGSTGLGGSGGNAIEFAGSTLYHSNTQNLHVLDTASGLATVVAPMGFQTPFANGDARLAAMKRHPGSGTVYCLIKGGTGGTLTWLGTVDLATGAVTNIGDTGVGTLDAIAFVPGPYTVVSAAEPNDGSFSWLVPNTPTELARVRIRGGDGLWAVGEDLSNQVFAIQDITGAPVQRPALSLLGAVSPNPARGAAVVSYSISRPAYVRLTVHDVRGRMVSTLVDGRLDAGPRVASWDGRNAGGAAEPSGVYLVRFEVDGEVQTSRFTLLR